MGIDLKEYGRFREEGLIEGEGIVVASDLSQEWLLPWFWSRLQEHNAYPVSFVDFGLSREAKKWCEKRGELVYLPLLDCLVKDAEEVEKSLAHDWEQKYGESFWSFRKAWFKKPFACLRSPYKKSLWLDLDCEVIGSLAPLFAVLDCCGLAITRDRVEKYTGNDLSAAFTPAKKPTFESFPVYNSGVIAFQRGESILLEWAELSLQENHRFRGDQDILSEILSRTKSLVFDLPSIYNHNIGYGTNPEAIIYHWVGERAKQLLRDQLALQNFH